MESLKWPLDGKLTPIQRFSRFSFQERTKPRNALPRRNHHTEQAPYYDQLGCV